MSYRAVWSLIAVGCLLAWAVVIFGAIAVAR